MDHFGILPGLHLSIKKDTLAYRNTRSSELFLQILDLLLLHVQLSLDTNQFGFELQMKHCDKLYLITPLRCFFQLLC